MLHVFAMAFLLGVVFNATPGPVFAETVKRGIQGGFRPALTVQLASLVGDATWAILGLTGVGVLVQIDVLRLPIGVAGVGYLLFLAWQSWRDAKHPHLLSHDPARNTSSAARSGMILSLSNPQNIGYWAALGSAMGAIGLSQPQALDYALFFAGFMTSSVLWCFICAGLVDQLYRRAGLGWASLTYRLCAIAFLYLAIASLTDLLRSDSATPTVDQSRQMDYHVSRSQIG